MSTVRKQNIEKIPLKDLALWTENPRDVIPRTFTNTTQSNKFIAERAINGVKNEKWALNKLYKKMKIGTRYDLSELPTVVYRGDTPVVYDGNRRILIGKIQLGYIKIINCPDYSGVEFPEIIPCNVCDEKTAIENIFRKHSESGSWGQLERDVFANKFQNKEKSPLLVLDEGTGVISQYPFMNKRFVSEEIFTTTTLFEMGFLVSDGILKSIHKSEADAKQILETIVHIINDGTVSTRENRGMIVNELKNDIRTQKIMKTLDKQRGREECVTKPKFQIETPIVKKKESLIIDMTSRQKNANLNQIFGGELRLSAGIVKILYQVIGKIFILLSKKSISVKSSPQVFFDGLKMIIRMSLRLICEIAAKEEMDDSIKSSNKALENYVRKYYPQISDNFTHAQKEFLSGHGLRESSYT